MYSILEVSTFAGKLVCEINQILIFKHFSLVKGPTRSEDSNHVPDTVYLWILIQVEKTKQQKLP